MVSYETVGQILSEVEKMVSGKEVCMKKAFAALKLSARAYTRLLKVSRTIADLAGSENIEAVHLAEAIQLRTSVRQ